MKVGKNWLDACEADEAEVTRMHKQAAGAPAGGDVSGSMLFGRVLFNVEGALQAKGPFTVQATSTLQILTYPADPRKLRLSGRLAKTVPNGSFADPAAVPELPVNPQRTGVGKLALRIPSSPL